MTDIRDIFIEHHVDGWWYVTEDSKRVTKSKNPTDIFVTIKRLLGVKPPEFSLEPLAANGIHKESCWKCTLKQYAPCAVCLYEPDEAAIRKDERKNLIQEITPRIKQVIENWKHSPFKIPSQIWDGWGEAEIDGDRHFHGIEEVLEQEQRSEEDED